MKHLLVIIFTLGFFVQNSIAQNSKLVGSWLVTKVEAGGEIQEPYQVTEFTSSGKMVMMGMEVASWKYNKNTNSIEMESDFDKDFSGVAKIVKLNADELIFIKDDVKVFYQKLDENKIAANNKISGVIGTWVLKGVPYPYANTYLTFKEPDEFTMIQKQEGMESSSKGTWIFDKQKMSLIMIGLRGEDILKGENKVVKIDDETIELENNGTVFNANKKAENAVEIEHLTFTEDDFFTEDGDFKYEADLEKLPWQDPMMMMMSLVNVKHLVYKYSVLVENAGVFEDIILTADVVSNPQEQELSIDNVFYGYDRYNLPEDTALPSNDDYDHILYPDEENTFRLAGSEEITTPAGTFNCTVVEVITSRDACKKLWMIIDKPGVYAKIIEDKPGTWGYYNVYELQAIKE